MKVIGNIITAITLPISLIIGIILVFGIALDMGAAAYFKLYDLMPDSWFAWAFWREK